MILPHEHSWVKVTFLLLQICRRYKFIKFVQPNFAVSDDKKVSFFCSQGSVENGIIRIRDRETSWFEQIHAVYITQRMVKIFQDRFVADTLTKISAAKKEKNVLSPETEKKVKRKTKQKSKE